MKKQKIIKIGNSAGVTIPYEIREQTGISLGDSVAITYNDESIVISKKESKVGSSISPHFLDVIEKVNKQYKVALKKLANK
jgi:antitoxin MazE